MIATLRHTRYLCRKHLLLHYYLLFLLFQVLRAKQHSNVVRIDVKRVTCPNYQLASIVKTALEVTITQPKYHHIQTLNIQTDKQTLLFAILLFTESRLWSHLAKCLYLWQYTFINSPSNYSLWFNQLFWPSSLKVSKPTREWMSFDITPIIKSSPNSIVISEIEQTILGKVPPASKPPLQAHSSTVLFSFIIKTHHFLLRKLVRQILHTWIH